MKKQPPQLALGFVEQKPRCGLCGRVIEKRCKWCFKGGLGDPPCPEQLAFHAWQKGLIRTLTRALSHLPSPVVLRAIRYVFFDKGELPEEARSIAAPYLARPCSPGRYNRLRALALIANQIRERYAASSVVDLSNPYQARFVDVLVTLFAHLIEAVRARGIAPEQAHAEELLIKAHVALEASHLVDPNALTDWNAVHLLALAVTNDVEAAILSRKRVATFEPAPRIRVALPDDVRVEEEALAEQEAAHATVMLSSRAARP